MRSFRGKSTQLVLEDHLSALRTNNLLLAPALPLSITAKFAKARKHFGKTQSLLENLETQDSWRSAMKDLSKGIATAVVIGAVSFGGMNIPAIARPQPQEIQQPQDKKQKKQERKAQQQQNTQQQQTDRQQRKTQKQLQQQQQNAQQQQTDRQQRKSQKQLQQQQQNAQQQQPDKQRRKEQSQQELNAQQREHRQRTPQERRELIQEQQHRVTQYRQHLEQQERRGREHTARLHQQRRLEQYRFQQEYLERLRRQHLAFERHHDYDRDPYFYTAYSYRYSRGGVYYETNQYGVNLLRQAVNYGYSEGYRAGRADRLDHWAYGYEDSYAYLDANYGYSGFYVDQETYNYYFREGFRHGYEDGYHSRYKYGRYYRGSYTILGSLLNEILGVEPL